MSNHGLQNRGPRRTRGAPGGPRQGGRVFWWWAGLLLAGGVLGGLFLLFEPGEKGAEEPMVADEAEQAVRVDEAASAPEVLFLPSAMTLHVEDAREELPARAFEVSVLASGLRGGLDGLAIHPVTGVIYVTLEDVSEVVALVDGPRVVIDRDTPVYRMDGGERARQRPLTFPEGLAFTPCGEWLYVAEDVPDGRLLRFGRDESGVWSGWEVALPGVWQGYAWEGLAISEKGEMLLAGSNVEAAVSMGGLPLFSGALLYRDAYGCWWLLQQQMFSSFSGAVFSKSGQQAIYICEVSGELAWLDLTTRQVLYGTHPFYLKEPEGLCVLPDGTFLVAEERGTVVAVSPASEQVVVVAEGLGEIESVVWDDQGGRALVTSDERGMIYALQPSRPYDADRDAMRFASYHPAYTPRHIPGDCPDYLASVLRKAGLDFLTGHEPGFSSFARRIPLVAADVVAVLEESGREVEDPFERVQFAVFLPNVIALDGNEGAYAPLALFTARTASGQMVSTTTLEVNSHFISHATGRSVPFSLRHMTLPAAGAVDVFDSGTAVIQLVGLGRGHDYSLLINPRQPQDSHMLVHDEEGEMVHYRLRPPPGRGAEAWVISVLGERHSEWIRLGDGP